MYFPKRQNLLFIFLLLKFTFSPFFLSSQSSNKGTDVFISPRITLGYTFGSGLNYGFDIVLGLYKVNDFKFGMDFTYYLVNTEQGIHRIKGFGVVGEMQYFSFKLGAGSVSRKWGFKNRNKASAPGIMVDASLGIDAFKAPWLGVKSFIFKKEKWEFYDQPSYISVYTYFRSADIEVFKQEPKTVGQ